MRYTFLSARRLRKKSLPYIFVSPFIILIICLIIYPLVTNFSLSLVKGGRLSFETYAKFLKDPYFLLISKNTAIWTAGSVFFQTIIGLSFALLLNQKFKGRTVFRAIILVLPWATPDVVAAVSWRWMYNDMYGVFNDVLVHLGILRDYLPWLADPILAKIGVIIANTWKGFSLSAMFYLAALQTVPREMYEAAKIDGAGPLNRFRFITLPVIKPVILTTLMLITIWTINYYPLIFIMTGGGPGMATETLVTFAYRVGFRFLDFSLSAVVSTITFLIILAISTIYAFFIFRRE